MRVTNNMLVSTMISNLNANLRKMDTYQSQLATGHQIQLPSDNPILSSKILKYNADLSDLNQYSTNTDDALSWMEITESSVADVGDVLQSVREQMVKAATASNTKDDLNKIADTVEQMKKQIISDGNATYAGRYIFSSFETDNKLFKTDGSYNIDVTQYKIDNKPVSQFQISQGENIDINTNGLDLFGVTAETGYMQTFMGDSTTKGTAATQSELTGGFSLTQNYTADTLDITLGGNTYTVDSTGLDGTTTALDKSTVLSRFQDASFGGTPLSTVADVYFDAANNLVIKAKAVGNSALSTASGIYAPTMTAGTALAETVASSANSLTDADVSLQGKELSKPFYATVNGVSKRIQVDASSQTTVAGYVSTLQTAMDNAFGAGKVTVAGVDGSPITFTSNSTPSDGTVPTIQIENIKATKSTMIDDLNKVIDAMRNGFNSQVGDYLTTIDDHISKALTIRSDIGARTNRLELVSKRLDDNKISFTKLLSSAQDVDMAEAIMNYKNAENVYRASLSTGAQTIQPTLVDFIK